VETGGEVVGEVDVMLPIEVAWCGIPCPRGPPGWKHIREKREPEEVTAD
jgi:hypothetical protein